MPSEMGGGAAESNDEIVALSGMSIDPWRPTRLTAGIDGSSSQGKVPVNSGSVERSGGRGDRSASRSRESIDRRSEKVGEVGICFTSISSDAYDDDRSWWTGYVGAFRDDSRSGNDGRAGEAWACVLIVSLVVHNLSDWLEWFDSGGVATRSQGSIGRTEGGSGSW